MRKIICSVCGGRMYQEKSRDLNFKYWQCKKGCRFHYPVFEEKLSTNEKKFIKSLK